MASVINAQPNVHERRDWWYSCTGTCCVCGVPLMYPSPEEGSRLQRRTDVDTFLFQYGLLHGIESGHLVDRYILDTVRRFIRNILRSQGQFFHDGPVAFEGLHLRTGTKWINTMRQVQRLDDIVTQADRFTVPICHDCNIAMTKVQTDIMSVFYNLLRPDYFEKQRVPYEFLRDKGARDSKAKRLQAIFVFTDLVPVFMRGDVEGDDATDDLVPSADDNDEGGVEEDAAIDLLSRYGKLDLNASPEISFDEDEATDNAAEAATGARFTIHAEKAKVAHTSAGKPPADPDMPMTKEYETILQASGPLTQDEAESLVGLRVLQEFPLSNKKSAYYWGEIFALQEGPAPGWTWRVYFPDKVKQNRIIKHYQQDELQTAARNVFDPKKKAKYPQSTFKDFKLPPPGDSGVIQEVQSSPLANNRSGAPPPVAVARDTETSPFVWVVKHKLHTWQDFSLVKIVSHLMQWGATKHGRQRVLAVFWSAHYLWLSYTTQDEQNLMDFKIWFTNVFRQYYMRMFPENTWFMHDSLTVAQITNANSNMEENAGVSREGADWLQWVRGQLQVLQPDVMGINQYVFYGEVGGLRIPEMADFIPTKTMIKDMLDDMREQVWDAQTLFGYFDNGEEDEGQNGINFFFRWYLFSMRGTKTVRGNVKEFINRTKRLFAQQERERDAQTEPT